MADSPDNQEDSAIQVPDDDTTAYDDEKTSQAIDEIVAKEGDAVLAAEDEKSAERAPVKARRAHGGRLSVLLHSKVFWWMVVLLGIGGAAAAAALPASRYWILNTAGVKAGASVVTVDDTTGLPVKGVSFRIGGKTAESDAAGKATVTGLRLGSVRMVIEQAGFEKVDRSVTIGWGSNPLGTYKLKAAGVSYNIEVRDYLSNKPLEGVQAVSGDSTAVSDKKGKIRLNLDKIAGPDDTVQLSKDGYRTDDITLQADPKQPTAALLVVSKKNGVHQ